MKGGKNMKKLMHFLGCLLMVLAMAVIVLPQEARAEFPERPVGFVVIDQDGYRYVILDIL